MKHKGRDLSYRKRLFISIVLVALLPLSILSVFAYHTYTAELSERLDVSTASMAAQTEARVDNLLTSIRQYYTELFQRDDLNWLLEKETATQYYQEYVRLKPAMEQLGGSSFFSEYIQSYSLVSLKNGWVVSRRGLYSLDKITNPEELEVILGLLPETLARTQWINHIDYPVPTAPSSNYLDISGLLLMLRIPATASEPQAVMLVNVNPTALGYLMSENLNEYSVVVLDGDGKLVGGNDPLLAQHCQENAAGIIKTSGVTQITLDTGSSYRLASSASTANGLTFIVGYNRDIVSEGADRILWFGIGVVLVIALLLVLSQLGAHWLYRPIKRLTYSLTAQETGKEAGSEFEHIERRVQALIGGREAMERVISDQKEMLMELFLLRLIRGELSYEQIKSSAQRLRLMPRSYYTIMSVSFITAEADITTDQDALQLLILEQLPDSVKEKLYTKPVNNGGSLVLLLANDSIDKLEEQILQAYNGLDDFVHEKYGCHVTVGVSRIFEALSDTRTAYLESNEALKNKAASLALPEESGIFFYLDMQRGEEDGEAEYDLQTEREVLAAIDACDMERAFAGVYKFMQGQSETGSAPHEQNLHLHRFLVAILMVPTNAGLSLQDIYAADMPSVFDLIGRYNRTKTQKIICEQIVLPIIHALEEFRQNRVPEMLDQVIALVQEKKGNITLTECADALGYHPSYIWKVLKAQRNMTFTDFVAYEKLELAKDMLLNTDQPVAQIAETLSYTNAQNFIRFFSKHVGTTPGKFRRDQNGGGLQDSTQADRVQS